MKAIAYSKDALRALKGMPTNIRELIVSKIEAYAADPASMANNIKRLKGYSGAFRLRVGDWRVIMTDDAKMVAVIKIATRGSVY